MVELSFLGACREVGRAGVLIEYKNTRLLLDYGIKIRPHQPPEMPVKPDSKIDAVLLTHCHLDHSGAIPSLYHSNPGLKVYGTPLTRDLSELLLYDSIKVAKMENYPIEFGEREVEMFHKNYRSITPGSKFKIGDIKVRAFHAGHIPGSLSYLLEVGKRRILYTGDYKYIDTQLVEGVDLDMPKVDILITESTYSTREHPPRPREEKRLAQIVAGTCKAGGTALIAGFAVARLNEAMIAIFRKSKTKCRLYLDGMARTATDIIRKHGTVRDKLLFEAALNTVNYVTSQKMRKKILKKPSIILTTSGMLEGGPVLFYLSKLYDSENSSLLITGFQVEGSRGDRLLKTGEIVIEDAVYKPSLRIERINLSAHVDRPRLLNFIKALSPRTVFCMHGEETNKFAKELSETMGVEGVEPRLGVSYKI